MDRRTLPPAAVEPDMTANGTEIRVPEHAARHDLRNGREAIS